MSSNASASQNTSNQTRTRPSRGRGQGAIPARSTREVVAAPLVTSGTQDVVLRKSPGLPGDSLVVVIPGGNGNVPTRSLTIHRPVGVTKLAADDWVVTNTVDVPFLLARVENPAQKAQEKEREALQLKLLADAGHLKKVGGRYVYNAGDGKTSREKALEAAREKAVAKLQSGVSPTTDAIIAELPQEIRDVERKVRTELSSKTFKSKVKEALAALPAYETLGGPDRDQPQVAVPAYRGKSGDEIAAWITSVIRSGPVSAPEPVKGSYVDKGKAKAD